MNKRLKIQLFSKKEYLNILLFRKLKVSEINKEREPEGRVRMFIISIILIIPGLLLALKAPFLAQRIQGITDLSKKNLTFSEMASEIPENSLAILQDNALLPISPVSNLSPLENSTARIINVVVTAYSSSPWETDGDPFISAAGTQVRDGIVANNLFPFGTKVRIPEIYGDKVFVVEDRMHWRKGYYHIDIWFPSYWQALDFGAKRTYIEILES